MLGWTVTRHTCPFCGWHHDDHGPEADGALALPGEVVLDAAASVHDAVTAYARAAYRRHCANIERILQAHIDTHVEEMARP